MGRIKNAIRNWLKEEESPTGRLKSSEPDIQQIRKASVQTFPTKLDDAFAFLERGNDKPAATSVRVRSPIASVVDPNDPSALLSSLRW